jgi:hypothetical protein
LYTTFHSKATELDETFLKTLKTLFKSKRIAISVEEELDETDYLLSTDANRKHLEESLNSKEKISFSLDELKQRKNIGLFIR